MAALARRRPGDRLEVAEVPPALRRRQLLEVLRAACQLHGRLAAGLVDLAPPGRGQAAGGDVPAGVELGLVGLVGRQLAEVGDVELRVPVPRADVLEAVVERRL